jgi:hypothetical protein
MRICLRRREFIAALGGAAVWPLAAGAQQQDDRVRPLVDRILRQQVEAVANEIGQFIGGIESQMGWTTQLTWSSATIEQRRFDGLRLLKQVPAITELAQLDPTGKERLRVSRVVMNLGPSEKGEKDYSHDPKFAEAVAKKVYYGPVYLRRESEPYMTLSVAGARLDAGVSVAEVNLKVVWDLMKELKVGEHGVIYVLDGQGRVIAHSDLVTYSRDAEGRVVYHVDTSVFQRDHSRLAHVQAARAAGASAGTGAVQLARDINGREVLATYSSGRVMKSTDVYGKLLATSTPLAGLGWLVFVEISIENADALAR